MIRVAALIVAVLFYRVTSEVTSLSSLRKDDVISSKEKLSVLLLHSMFPSHFLPLLSLGAELSSRGHRVTSLGPVLEGYEHLFIKRAQSLGLETIETNRVSSETFKMYSQSSEHEEGLISTVKWIYNMSLFFTSPSFKKENYLVKIRETIDTLNSSDYDYIISEHATMSLLYYTQRKWSIEDIMLVTVVPDFIARSIVPWPYPSLLICSSDDMSFSDRLLSALFLPLETFLMSFLGKALFVAEDECYLPSSNLLEVLLYQPTLYTTVIGIELPQVILPLQHFLGPLLPPDHSLIDSRLSTWLENASNAPSPVIYISMGTTVFINREMAEALLKLSSKYRLVWSLRESNQHILLGLNINNNTVYVAPWVAQFSVLGHSSVKLAILHCGINGIQEAFYNEVPVLCIPGGADQYILASRLQVKKLGLWLNAKDANEDNLKRAVSTILVKEKDQFKENAKKMSGLFKAAGGVKKGADLVELYAEIGYKHGLPSFICYEWNFIQYYNIDVWCVLVILLLIGLMGCRLCCGCFCRRFCCCCCWRQSKENKAKTD